MGLMGDGGDDGLARLTARERECLRLVDDHLSSKEIARRLGLSKHTIDAHLDKARSGDPGHDGSRCGIAGRHSLCCAHGNDRRRRRLLSFP